MNYEQSHNSASLAKIFNLSQRRIQQLAKDGVIQQDDNDGYPLLESTKGYVEFLHRRIDNNNRQALVEEKIKLTRAQRQKIDIEIDQITNGLIPQDEFNIALNAVLQATIAMVDSLTSTIEKEIQLPAECLDRIDEIAMALREEIKALMIEKGLH